MKKFILIALIFTCSIYNLIAQQTNNALHFESNSYVELDPIAQDVSNLSEFTVEFWVKFNGQLNTDYNVFYGVNPNDYGNRFLLRFAGPVDGVSDAAVVYIDDGSEQTIIGTTSIGDDKCHHIAFTYYNGACSLYVDGQLDASGNYTFAFQTTDFHSLGQEYDAFPTIATSQFYNGELDDFRFWNIAKTQNEIDNNKGVELVGNESNLLVYFNFNQGISGGNNTSISTLNNLSQPTQNGTFVDFSLNGSASNFVSGGCSNSAVEINEIEGLFNVEVSPNPTCGLLNISNHETISSITVRNLLGQIILSFEPSSTIDISGLPHASYFIEFLTEDGRADFQKLSNCDTYNTSCTQCGIITSNLIAFGVINLCVSSRKQRRYLFVLFFLNLRKQKLLNKFSHL